MEYQNLKLGQLFRKLRKERGETLHQVSRVSDIDSPLLSKIERSERLPTLDQLNRLCCYFEVNESEIRIIYTAEKIIKEYGVNETTFKATQLVHEKIVPFIITN